MRNELNEQEHTEIEVMCEDLSNKEVYSFRNIRVRKKKNVSMSLQQVVMENADISRFLENASVFSNHKEIIDGDGSQRHYQLLLAVLLNDSNDGCDTRNSQQISIDFITLKESENIFSNNSGIVKIYFWRLRKPMSSKQFLDYHRCTKQQYQVDIKQEEGTPLDQNNSMYRYQLQKQQARLVHFEFEDLEQPNLSDLRFHISLPVPQFLISNVSNCIANSSQQLLDLREIFLSYPLLCSFIEDAVIFLRLTNNLRCVERRLLGVFRIEKDSINSNQNLFLPWDGISRLQISFFRLEKQHPRFSIPMVISQIFNAIKREDIVEGSQQLNQQQQAHQEASPILETQPLILHKQANESFQVKSEEILTSQQTELKIEHTEFPLQSLRHLDAVSIDKTIKNEIKTVDNCTYAETPIQKRKPQPLLKTRGGRGSEKQIGWALQRVLEWRYINHNKSISLAAAANELGLTKQSLDNYFLELRIGELFGFDLLRNLESKFGVIRQFNKKAIEMYHNTTNKAKIPILSELKFTLEEFNEWRTNQRKNNKDVLKEVKEEEDEGIEEDLEEELCQKSMECSKTLLPKMETTQWPFETECNTHSTGLILRKNQQQQHKL